MSFRVKTTHQLLQTNPAPGQEKPTLSFFETDEKNGNYISTFLTNGSGQKPVDNRPAQSSTKGIAIRTITAAQADHM